LGQLGFALRVTHAFYHNGTLQGSKLLGYVELGSEIGGFVDAPVATSSEDEIGRFEILFEQLRLVFVNLLEEYDKAISSPDRKGG
jgi:hypothetical protein